MVAPLIAGIAIAATRYGVKKGVKKLIKKATKKRKNVNNLDPVINSKAVLKKKSMRLRKKQVEQKLKSFK
tara:strand:- start:890 stop:1099 length:210 start_codon:yes stop_codon:yes gene_type:complete